MPRSKQFYIVLVVSTTLQICICNSYSDMFVIAHVTGLNHSYFLFNFSFRSDSSSSNVAYLGHLFSTEQGTQCRLTDKISPLLVPEANHFLNSGWMPSKYDGIWAAWGAWRNGRVIVGHRGIMNGPPFRCGMGRSDLKPHGQRMMEEREDGSVGRLLWLIIDNQLL